MRAAHRSTLDRLALLPGLDRTDPASAPEIEDAYYVATTTAGDLRAALQIGREVQADALVGRHPFIAASDLAARGRMCRSRSPITTRAPSATNRPAMASPMP